MIVRIPTFGRMVSTGPWHLCAVVVFDPGDLQTQHIGDSNRGSESDVRVAGTYSKPKSTAFRV